MATILYKNNSHTPNEEDRILQGDYVFCKGNDGALDFWGVYNAMRGIVICLDGGGTSYITGKIYLNETYVHWTITKRIRNEKAKITIEETD